MPQDDEEGAHVHCHVEAERSAQDPIAEVMRKVWPRAHCDAVASDYRWNQLVVMRKKSQRARRLDCGDLHRVEPDVPFRPRPAIADGLVIQSHVVREIGGIPKWVRSIPRERR